MPALNTYFLPVSCSLTLNSLNRETTTSSQRSKGDKCKRLDDEIDVFACVLARLSSAYTTRSIVASLYDLLRATKGNKRPNRDSQRDVDNKMRQLQTIKSDTHANRAIGVRRLSSFFYPFVLIALLAVNQLTVVV